MILVELDDGSHVPLDFEILQDHSVCYGVGDLRKIAFQIAECLKEHLRVFLCVGQFDHAVHVREIEPSHSIFLFDTGVSQQVTVEELQVRILSDLPFGLLLDFLVESEQTPRHDVDDRVQSPYNHIYNAGLRRQKSRKAGQRHQ